MGKNILKEKSFSFALRVVKLFQYLQNEKKEYILSKQLMRSGTSVGALYREAEHSESKADFIHKLAIAQKECNESLYWLELLNQAQIIDNNQFKSIYSDAEELMKLLTSIIKSTKLTTN